MKLLLHTCCAPCSVMCIESLRAEGIDPVLFWYNPNIHPYTEYKNRRDTLIAYAAALNLELVTRDEYGLRAFIAGLYAPGIEAENPAVRCAYCYRLRLEAAARTAAERGFDAFSTTLLASPYQKHELICETAETADRQNGIRFLYRDFRPSYREGQRKAREAGLYTQKYCGCVFSEEERYLK
ncbi:MAG: epoxyqueuosine reductase QueH [Treponema sp.]|nr:epoxyqueuosine reductase QueH [Treponema sp.]